MLFQINEIYFSLLTKAARGGGAGGSGGGSGSGESDAEIAVLFRIDPVLCFFHENNNSNYLLSINFIFSHD